MHLVDKDLATVLVVNSTPGAPEVQIQSKFFHSA